jgi:hypothetical protein
MYCTVADVVAVSDPDDGEYVYTPLPSRLTFVFWVLPRTTVPGCPSLGSKYSSGGE